jgi:ubiquinone/menaquinone biosynthesis C-methylase UbiE
MTPDTIQELRRTSYQISQAIAPGWERWRARLENAAAPVREWMIRQLGPQPGDTLLELAAGAGDTGFEAAAIAGEAGRLISTDFSPAMVAVARRRAAELGLGNVGFRVIDAGRTGLGTHSVDGVLCRFGYMLMADPAAALAESRRVLRPGGRLVLAVWGARSATRSSRSSRRSSPGGVTCRRRARGRRARSAWPASSTPGNCWRRRDSVP